MPWAEKTYSLAKQIFVHQICKAGHGANLAFEYIHQIKLCIRCSEVEVDEIVDIEFLKKIDPDYKIIDYVFFAFLKLLQFSNFL